MENLEEVIRCLKVINQSLNNQNRAVLPPWQQKVIDEAGYDVPSSLNELELKGKAEKLDIEKQYADYAKAKYFCFVPNPNQTQSQALNQNFTVYVIDGSRNIIAKLEQLQTTTTSQIVKAFIVPIQ